MWGLFILFDYFRLRIMCIGGSSSYRLVKYEERYGKNGMRKMPY